MGELADIVNQAVDHQAARIAESDRRIRELEAQLAQSRKAEAERCGVQVHMVANGDLRSANISATIGGVKSKGQLYAALPLYTSAGGMIRRQCTQEYKIQPIHRKLRELCGLRPHQRGPKSPVVKQLFGISADEPARMRDARHPWIINAYPLIYELPKPYRREDCYRWLERTGWGDTPRSACIGCPFHSDREWRRMRDSDQEAWADAVEFDAAIRNRDKLNQQAFLHRSRVPLSEVDLSTPAERGQPDLWDNECEGICGV